MILHCVRYLWRNIHYRLSMVIVMLLDTHRLSFWVGMHLHAILLFVFSFMFYMLGADSLISRLTEKLHSSAGSKQLIADMPLLLCSLQVHHTLILIWIFSVYEMFICQTNNILMKTLYFSFLRDLFCQKMHLCKITCVAIDLAERQIKILWTKC